MDLQRKKKILFLACFLFVTNIEISVEIEQIRSEALTHAAPLYNFIKSRMSTPPLVCVERLINDGTRILFVEEVGRVQRG